MTEIIPVKLSNGTIVHMEAQPINVSNSKRQKVSNKKAKEFSFDTVKKQLQSFSEDLHGAFDSVKPDTLKIEVGCEFVFDSGEIVALFVKGSAKSNLKITLEWNNLSPTRPRNKV